MQNLQAKHTVTQITLHKVIAKFNVTTLKNFTTAQQLAQCKHAIKKALDFYSFNIDKHMTLCYDSVILHAVTTLLSKQQYNTAHVLTQAHSCFADVEGTEEIVFLNKKQA